MATRIFDRPDLDQRPARLALLVVGQFPMAKPLQAYEGRLQVVNGVGGLSVEQVDGDKLPNGAGIYIDSATREVVVTWPAYVETLATIPNPGFETGDVNWDKGPGWSIGTENPPTGARAARYGDNYGSSIIANAARYPVNPGRPITAVCRVRQGASSEGNAGAAVQLQWRSADGQLVQTSEGNAVMSASKNRVYPSTVTATPPPSAALVNVSARGIRNRQNKPLFIDDFSWDHQQLTGIAIETVLALTLRVRDSGGQSYLWRGQIRVAYAYWDNNWNVRYTLDGGHTVAYSPLLDRMVTGSFADDLVGYSNDRGKTWTRYATGLASPKWEDIIWSERLSIFISTGLSRDQMWSADGITWAKGLGDTSYGLVLVETPAIVYAIGSDGSAMVSRSVDGKSWSWSGTSLPSETMGVCTSAAYSPSLNRVISGHNGGRVMYQTGSLSWATNSGVVDPAGIATVLWSVEHAKFFLLTKSSPSKILSSATGVGAWTLEKVLPATMGACGGFAWSPIFGFVVVKADGNRFCRLNANLDVTWEQDYDLGGDVTTMFSVRWVPSLGKFIFNGYSQMAISTSEI